MKQTKKISKKEMKTLQKNNPDKKFRVSFCKDAKEFVTQVYEGKSGWLCLHN